MERGEIVESHGARVLEVGEWGEGHGPRTTARDQLCVLLEWTSCEK